MPAHRSRRLFILLAIFLIPALLSFFLMSREQRRIMLPAEHKTMPQPPVLPQTQPPLQSSAEKAPAAPAMGYRAGQHLTYQFHQVRDMAMRMKQLPTVPQMQDVVLKVSQKGRLNVRVLSDILRDDKPAGWWMEFRWTEPAVEAEVGQISDPEQRRQMRETCHILENEIAQGVVLAEILPSGRIRQMRAVSIAPGEALNHWKDLLSRWQVTLADDAGAPEWDASEEDSTGVYLARYRTVAGAPGRRLVKKKVRYTEIHADAPSPDASRPPRAAVEGETLIDMDSYPGSITGEEVLRLARAGMFFVRGRSTFRLQLISSEMAATPPAPEQAADIQKRMEASSEEITWINTVDPRAARRNPPPVKPQDIEDLIDALKRLHNRGGAESPEELDLARRLIEGCRAGGAPVVSQIMDSLTDDRDDAAYAAVLTGVLGAADTQDAHRALLAIVADAEWPMGIRKLALESSVQVTRPVEESDDVLRRLCEEDGPLSETALLILGVTGDRVRDESPERFDEISDFIEEQTDALLAEDGGQDMGELLLVLAAVGNLGPPEIPSVVTQALAHAEADIRAQAVLSLAHIQTDEALALILEALRNDEEEDVRVIALRLAGNPARPGALALLLETLATSPSERLRTEALAGLDSWSDDETVIGAVQAAADGDPSASIREYAEDWLRIHIEGRVEEDQWLTDDESGASDP